MRTINRKELLHQLQEGVESLEINATCENGYTATRYFFKVHLLYENPPAYIGYRYEIEFDDEVKSSSLTDKHWAEQNVEQYDGNMNPLVEDVRDFWEYVKSLQGLSKIEFWINDNRIEFIN